VRAHEAGSHFNQGWEIFTDKVIRIISEETKHVVFMLWGSPARAKKSLIDSSKHLILEAPHPSPLSAHRGFLGCKHFSQANEYLKAHGLEEINWDISC
jgi:uracil-DNA glycosylase